MEKKKIISITLFIIGFIATYLIIIIMIFNT